MGNSPNSQRTAIVTGAAGDLGSVIARRLAEDGYMVAVTDLPERRQALQTVADAISKAGTKSFVVTGDIIKEADVQNIVAETVKHLGPLDVMVSNVGKFVGCPITQFKTEDWDDMFQVNVKGMMLCYKTAANQMLKQKAELKDRQAHYRIIGGCSVAGFNGAPLCAAYAGTKFAVRGITQVAAAELGQFGITVNAYAPGFVGGTKMLDNLDNCITNFAQIPEGAWRTQALDTIKVKKFGDPKNISAMVSYLASEDADWTTGQTIIVDGGMYMT